MSLKLEYFSLIILGSLPIATNIIAHTKKNKNTAKNKTIIIENGIHIGEVTHHHDQLILFVNFNVKKIVQIDDSFYHVKNYKNSILYFENNGKTESVEFSKIALNDNKVNEDNKIIINFNTITK